jgi:hypothetical protein
VKRQKKSSDLTGLSSVDRLPDLTQPTLDDYLKAVSEYVREQRRLDASQKKTAQIALSQSLGKALLINLREHLPEMKGEAGERKVAGALRVVKADVSEYHELDGLRLAVEIKPVNLAVGRAIWNRFGDIRAFAVNLHLKFPFAVVGGVLVIPTYEERNDGTTKATTHLIQRAVGRLVRAGGRRTEGDAPHLLEAIAVVVFDPATAKLAPDLPPKKSGLRWDDFVTQLATVYDSRFGSELAASDEDEANERE